MIMNLFFQSEDQYLIMESDFLSTIRKKTKKGIHSRNATIAIQVTFDHHND